MFLCAPVLASAQEESKKYKKHILIEREAEYGVAVSDSTYEKLDRIIEETRKRLSERKLIKKKHNEEEAKLVLAIIASVLIDQGYKVHATDAPLLSEALNNDLYDCDVGSHIYLTVIERLGLKLPVSMVILPKHAFLKWQDGKRYFDWEVNFEHPREMLFAEKYLEIAGKFSQYHPDYHKAQIADTKDLDSLHFYAIGRYWHAKNDFDKAKKAYKESLDANPENYLAMSNMATLLDIQGRTDEAINIYSLALEIEPDYALAYYDRGIAYYSKFEKSKKLDNLNSAINDFSKAIELQPEYVPAYFKRGATYHDKYLLTKDAKLFDAARADYERAVAIDPAHNRAKKALESLVMTD